MVSSTMMVVQVSLYFTWMLIFSSKEVFGSFVYPVKFTRVGCFEDSQVQPRPLSQLLFTDRDKSSRVFSGKPIHWGNWDAYLSDVICRCAERTKAKGYNVFSVQHYGECWSGCGSEDTFNRDGNSSRCITYDFKACGPQDKYCAGKSATNFVYTLNGHNFLVGIRKCPAAMPPTMAYLNHAHSVLEKIQNIYKGYSCLQCLKIVNESSSAVFLMLKFTCHGQHLKKLVSGIGAGRIIKAECSTPDCAYTHSAYSCPYPCGMSSCSISPSLPYPSICPVQAVHFPEQMLPTQCPMSCPSVCAPACNSLCCRSFLSPNSTVEQPSGQSFTGKTGKFDNDHDDDVIDGNTYV